MLPRRIRAVITSVALACLPSLSVGAVTAVVQNQFIFEHGPHPTNHASTIVETTEWILAAWFGGPKARDPLNSIYTARYDGTKWSKPFKILEGGEGGTRHQCWNPVLFQPSRGPLMLFYKVGPSPEEWWGMFATSTN